MLRTHRKSPSIKAFTLIELLVVIAIISVIAAILFPVFATAREKARQTECLSNLKQIGLAISQYTQDYDQTWPYDICGDAAVGTTNSCTGSAGEWDPTTTPTSVATYDPTVVKTTWVGQIFPYIKDGQVFQEPSSSYYASSVVATSDMVGYFSNGIAWVNPTSTGTPQPRTDNSFSSPAAVITVYDDLDKRAYPTGFGNSRLLWYRPFWLTNGWTDNGSFDPNTFRVGPHNLMYNALYADGHASSQPHNVLDLDIMPSNAVLDPGNAPAM